MPSGGGAVGFGGGAGGGVACTSHCSTASVYYHGRSGGCGGPRRKPSAKECCICLCIILTFIVILTSGIVLSSVLPVIIINADSLTTQNIATNFYSPGDSRLMSFSTQSCKSITIKVNSTATGAFLVLTNTTPSLTDQNTFNISDQRTLNPRRFRFWQYHLYPNSNISISVCSSSYSPVEVYLVKGNSNANKWSSSSSSKYFELFSRVRKRCPQEQTITYNVIEEDEYYVILFNSLKESDVSYNATLKYERFEYALPAVNTSLNSCFEPSGGQCILDIPYGTGFQQALVLTSVPANVDWAENIDINISCT